MKSLIHHLYKAIILVMVVMLGACATTQQNERVSRIDPLEPMNRAVFTFNENLDQYLVKPAAEAYKFVMPDAVRRGVTNFFSNIGDIFGVEVNLTLPDHKESIVVKLLDGSPYRKLIDSVLDQYICIMLINCFLPPFIQKQFSFLSIPFHHSHDQRFP